MRMYIDQSTTYLCCKSSTESFFPFVPNAGLAVADGLPAGGTAPPSPSFRNVDVEDRALLHLVKLLLTICLDIIIEVRSATDEPFKSLDPCIGRGGL